MYRFRPNDFIFNISTVNREDPRVTILRPFYTRQYICDTDFSVSYKGGRGFLKGVRGRTTWMRKGDMRIFDD